jgi:hypothetical protein
VDSGATENFLHLSYAKWLRLPIKRLHNPRRLFNVDGTENKNGKLQYYTDLDLQMGTNRITMRFFLAELGEHKAILGYPWFAANQPRIDWKNGWIDSGHLLLIARTPDVAKAKFTKRGVNRPRVRRSEDQYFIA